MSHSQFHSTNLFILRHAWLNLWDKHMTTGRINQITIMFVTLNTQPKPRIAAQTSGLHARSVDSHTRQRNTRLSTNTLKYLVLTRSHPLRRLLALAHAPGSAILSPLCAIFLASHTDAGGTHKRAPLIAAAWFAIALHRDRLPCTRHSHQPCS